MDIVYKEINDDESFAKCVLLQKDVFNLTDIEVISPLILKLISRNNPPIGIAIGAYNNNELVGTIVGLAAFVEKTVYVIVQGVMPEYRNNNIGYHLMLEFREKAIKKGLEVMNCIFNPLEANLARLFVGNLGFKGIKYEIEPYKTSNPNDNIPIDKVLASWKFNDPSTLEKLNRINSKIDDEIFKSLPVASIENYVQDKKILIEIPSNYRNLYKTDRRDAENWFYRSREIFNEYLNNQNYIITDFFIKESNRDLKYFYLLEKSIVNE